MSSTSLNKVPTLGANVVASSDEKSSAVSSKSINSVSDEKKATSKDLESGEKDATKDQMDKAFVFKGKAMVGVMLALALSMFLAALDTTIVSTMLPKITEKFDSLSKMTWIISSYVVASTALQPIYGKLCHIYGHQY
ncbi:hypothetical protein GGI23_005793, partial [Coemansia sp. RSA 2559]